MRAAIDIRSVKWVLFHFVHQLTALCPPPSDSCLMATTSALKLPPMILAWMTMTKSTQCCRRCRCARHVAVLALIQIRCHRLAVDSRQRRAAVIVDGDLVVVVLLLLFHNKRVFKSLIFTNFIFNALRVDHVTMNWQESFEKWNWLAIYITFVVAKRWWTRC